MNRPIHPFLFAIYPVLFLYSKNTAEFPPHVIAGPIFICVVFTLLAGWVIWRFFENRLRATILLSLFLILFFSYGHVYQVFEKSGISGNPKVALTIYAVLFATVMILCYKRIKDWQKGTRFFNMLSILLIAIPLITTASVFFKGSRPESATRTLSPAQHPSSAGKPDIFYIILDGYPRQDVLQKLHRFDNSPFLDHLRRNGFRILENSHSNYPGTSLSLASSLNFEYLEEIVPAEEIRTENQWFLKNLIENSRTVEFLEKKGYRTAAFDSGYFTTEMKNVDRFYATGWFLNEFHEALLDTTPAWVIFKNIGRYEIQRRRILYILDHLANVKDPSSPVFVFAHVMALHPPFVFGRNGEERNEGKSSLMFWKDFAEPSSEERSQQYQDQLTFINSKVKNMVASILANRTRPVLIVIQGDHGSSFVPRERKKEFFQERFSILNAILLPTENHLYDSMTPVNTFRVIFNSLFQTDFPMLADRSFYSDRDRPYHWEDITSELKDGL